MILPSIYAAGTAATPESLLLPNRCANGSNRPASDSEKPDPRPLEVGCGTGLLLFRLAPECAHYCALDFSQAVIEQLQQRLQTLPTTLSQVRLMQRAADQLDDFEDASFDTIVINSVVQYFPSVDYLRDVLRGLLRLCRPGGHIFLGDIRNYALQEVFANAIELAQSPPSLPVSELSARVRRRLAQEEELLIAPTFFASLPAILPRSARCRQSQTRTGAQRTDPLPLRCPAHGRSFAATRPRDKGSGEREGTGSVGLRGTPDAGATALPGSAGRSQRTDGVGGVRTGTGGGLPCGGDGE